MMIITFQIMIKEPLYYQIKKKKKCYYNLIFYSLKKS